MKIVILTQWYPPEPALLLQELAQSLQAIGHEVTVLTGFPNYPSGQLYPGYHLRLYQREMIEGIPVVRVALYPDHSTSRLGRIGNYLSFALSSAILGLGLVSRPDVLFVYHPPLTVGFPAFILSMFWRVPFVYQIQDMWPETLRATGMLNNEAVLDWVYRLAQWVYQRAKAILVISPGFRQNLIEKGVPEEKIHLVSNWVDTNVYYPAPPEPEKAEALGFAGRFNVMFAGNMGEAQRLHTVLEAAVLLQDLPLVQFVLVGDGIALPHLRQTAQEQGVSNVRFLGRYPASEMPKLYALADVLLVHLKDDPLFRITIPHKTFAYMASGKPILAAVAGDVADLITQAGAGLACSPEDAVSLAELVRRFYHLPPTERQAMGMNGLLAVRTNFNRQALVGQIASILEFVVKTESGRILYRA